MTFQFGQLVMIMSRIEQALKARIRSRRKKFWEKAVDIEELCGPDKAWWGVIGYIWWG